MGEKRAEDAALALAALAHRSVRFPGHGLRGAA